LQLDPQEDIPMKSFVHTSLAVLALAAAAGCATRPDTSPSASTTTVVPSSAGPVAIQGPVRGQVQHKLTGRVTEIDRDDSEITVRTPDGDEIELKLPPFALGTIREGDDVSMDLVIQPR
jgi:hypothetical protein